MSNTNKDVIIAFIKHNKRSNLVSKTDGNILTYKGELVAKWVDDKTVFITSSWLYKGFDMFKNETIITVKESIKHLSIIDSLNKQT